MDFSQHAEYTAKIPLQSTCRLAVTEKPKLNNQLWTFYAKNKTVQKRKKLPVLKSQSNL